MKSKMLFVARLLILVSILIVISGAINSPILAQTGSRERASKVSERKLVRLKRIKREAQSSQHQFRTSFQQMMDWMDTLYMSLDSLIQDEMDDLCYSFNKQNFCPPEPVIPEFSYGHTQLIRFDVTVTRYNPVRAQTDLSPCEGAFGNVCKAYEQGLNPIAASRDIAVYPLGRGGRIMIESKSLRNECKNLEGKVFTVMDTLSDCLYKNRELRTGRCTKPIENQIDIYTPCEDGDCMLGIAKAINFGTCQVVITKL